MVDAYKGLAEYQRLRRGWCAEIGGLFDNKLSRLISLELVAKDQNTAMPFTSISGRAVVSPVECLSHLARLGCKVRVKDENRESTTARAAKR